MEEGQTRVDVSNILLRDKRPANDAPQGRGSCRTGSSGGDPVKVRVALVCAVNVVCFRASGDNRADDNVNFFKHTGGNTALV